MSLTPTLLVALAVLCSTAAPIKNENSPDGRAHLCATMIFVYCFIPPPSGV